MEPKETNQTIVETKALKDAMMIVILGEWNKMEKESQTWTIKEMKERPLRTLKEDANALDQGRWEGEEEGPILDPKEDHIVGIGGREVKVEEDQAQENDAEDQDLVVVNTGMIVGMVIDAMTEDAMDMTIEEMEDKENWTVWREGKEKESERGKGVEVEKRIKSETGEIEMIELTSMNGQQNHRMRKILGYHQLKRN